MVPLCPDSLGVGVNLYGQLVCARVVVNNSVKAQAAGQSWI